MRGCRLVLSVSHFEATVALAKIVLFRLLFSHGSQATGRCFFTLDLAVQVQRSPFEI